MLMTAIASGIIYIGQILLQLSVAQDDIQVQGGHEAFIWAETNVPATIGLHIDGGASLGRFENSTAVGWVIPTVPVDDVVVVDLVAWARTKDQQTDWIPITLTILPE